MMKKALGSSNVRMTNGQKLAGKMRFFFLLLLLNPLLSRQAAAETNYDKNTFTAENEKPKKVPGTIEKQKGYHFSYNHHPANENSTLNTADTTIRGKVTDGEGKPLQDASILVQGTTNGTTSNASGEFTLKGVKENATLIISSVGFEQQTVKLTRGQSTVAISLQGEAGTLKDVVVTGFQRIEKSKFTGAATKLNINEVKTDGIIDVSRMLEGRAAGVSVQNVSGTFGAAPKIRIRGATSISGENKPLWVIDGVVLEDVINISNDQLASGDPNTLLGSAVAGLNANDIETFDILKDAAATALYGARAMNGVIVITTKRGKAGKPSVSYTGNFTYQLKPSYNNYDIMNSLDQMSVYAEIERKGYLPFSNLVNNANTGVYGRMDELIRNPDSTGKFAVENTPEGRAAFLARYAKANTDWFDILFRNSLTQEHSLSISSGTEKAQTYFSTSYYNDAGWTIADNVKRYTANFRNNYTFSNRLSAGFIIAGSVRQQRAPGTVSRISNPVEGSYDRDFDINPFSYALNTSRALTAYDENGNLEYFKMNYAPFNIINELHNNYIKLNMLDLKLQGEASYKITPNLRYEFFGALRFVKTSREHQIKENSNQAEAYRAAPNSIVAERNKYLYRDPDNPNLPPVVVLPYGGFYNRTEDQLMNYTFRNVLNYTKSINDKEHQITALIGQEVKYADRQNASNTGFGYQYQNGGVPFVDYRIVKQLLENNFTYYGMGNEYDRFVGFFANGSYSYKGKYTFNGTVREDGSNRLGKARSARWLPTWTVSGKWNVDRESFMDNIDAFSYLTLRGSYGLNASYGNATNSTVVLKSELTRRAYLSDAQAAISLQNIENADLTWEKKYEADIGTDFGLLNGRINVTIDAYKRDGFDLISLVKTSGIGGEVYKAANFADLKSHGIEFSAGGKVFDKKNWGWNTNLTFGYNTNKIVNAKNNPLIFDLVRPEGGAKEGYPVRGLFSLKFSGLSPWDGVAEFVSNEKGDTSHAIYLQSDTTTYLKYEGPVDPTFTGGFSNTFRYKNFSFNFLITYQAGNKIRLTPVYSSTYSDLSALPNEFKNRWSLPGDENFTNIPSIADLYTRFHLNSASAYPYNNYNYSSARVVDGSFVRLKTVSLIYNVPATTLQRFGLNTLSLNLVGNNLWLIYADPKLHGQDPEFFNAGGVALPINKQIVLSLKVGI
jgi:TonB-linked SusC/RagA family outer membrane protein